MIWKLIGGPECGAVVETGSIEQWRTMRPAGGASLHAPTSACTPLEYGLYRCESEGDYAARILRWQGWQG